MKEKQKEFVVYKIYHVDSGKSYIGITGDYKKRMREHFYCKDNCYIHKAIQKHGKEKFTTEIILECDSRDEAKKEEIERIKTYDTKAPNGYNLTAGGDGMMEHKPSKETCKKISEGNKGKAISEETREKMSKANKGKKHTNESRKKISEAKKGKKRTKEACKKSGDAHKKLSTKQILEIRKMILNKIIYKIISKKFNVHQSTIGVIKQNKRYSEIQLPEKN